jgi:hypothetical protein
MLKNPKLFFKGYHLERFPLSDVVRSYVHEENWSLLDDEFKKLCQKDGDLFRFLSSFHDFNSIEFIISIRDSQNEWEEDGIWHDDGSRVFAFSLSLNFNPELIAGGRLGIRRKGSDHYDEIKTPGFGDIILFLTGESGFEHKIHKVTEGRRIIIAGWCSK